MKANWKRSQAAPHLGRVAYRHFFRDEGYELQQTGKNIEDTAILHDLMAIGVDIKAWEEGIQYNINTGEVTFDA